MSLEESQIKLAAAQLVLADAFNNYAATLNKIANANPDSIVVHKVEGAGQAAADAGKPEKAKPGPKPKDKPAPAADADDGFGDEKKYTFEDAKAKLMEVKDKFGDKSKALEIIGKYGYKALPEIGEAHWAAIVADCDKWLAAN